MKVIVLSFLALCWTIGFVFASGMTEVYRWKQLDYYNRGSFSGSFRNIGNIWEFRLDDSKTYKPYDNVPMGASHYRGRLFITVPRRRNGIPSTLNFINITAEGSEKSPKLQAYPSFEQNQFRDGADGLVSVYRTTVDAVCQRLWFVDTGMLELPNDKQQIKRPSIWIVDLNTDRLIHRFQVPENIVDTGRGLASIAVDVTSNQCGHAFAYIPDLVKSRMYVYSMAENSMWAFDHNFFHFDPLAGDFSAGGQTFRWDDGIFSIALGQPRWDGSRIVYFNAMASNEQFAVSNKVLKNKANAARSDHGSDFYHVGSRGPNKQSTIHQYDPDTGVLFFAEIQTNGVGCFNTNHPLSAAHLGIVASDSEQMIYPSDLKIDEDGYIWVMTNSLPVYIYSSLDPNEYNFRVWKQHVREAIRNTVCQ